MKNLKITLIIHKLMEKRSQKIILSSLILSWTMFIVVPILFPPKNDDDWSVTILLLFWTSAVATFHVVSLIYFIIVAFYKRHSNKKNDKITSIGLCYFALLTLLFSILIGPLDFLQGLVSMIILFIQGVTELLGGLYNLR